MARKKSEKSKAAKEPKTAVIECLVGGIWTSKGRINKGEKIELSVEEVDALLGTRQVKKA